MDFKTRTATALLAALRLAREHGGAEVALRASGIELPDDERFEGLSSELEHISLESVALGLLAAQAAPARRERSAGEPTSFVMDPDLVVRDASGESILRLPWFEEGLFVGRQLPEISEMPAPVRTLCVENYSTALKGERGQFTFTSYGHAYTVEAVPVRGEGGSIDSVLAIATPARPYASAGIAYKRTAARLHRCATSADQRAELHALAGREDDAAGERQVAEKARRAAERAGANARRLRDPGYSAERVPDEPSPTPRERDVLQLASHGLTYAEIAAELGVSAATVRTHLDNAYQKLGVSDKAAAVAAALRHGLIE
jgi:DNA-binding CsgD family transcriptional regulator